MPELTRFRWLRRADDLRYEIKQGNFEAADLLDPLLNRPRWRLMRMTDDATMVGRERRRRLLKLAQQLDADGVEGDFVELGTFKRRTGRRPHDMPAEKPTARRGRSGNASARVRRSKASSSDRQGSSVAT